MGKYDVIMLERSVSPPCNLCGPIYSSEMNEFRFKPKKFRLIITEIFIFAERRLGN